VSETTPREAPTTGQPSASPRRVLSDDLLKTLHSRAAGYDRDNRFFAEDLEELREAGYLRAAIPEERGGLGLTLAEVNLEQRRLAYWAPSTALGLTMHLYWTGPAGERARAGDTSLDWLIEEIVAGKVLAAGHGEPGNDTALDDSLSVAVPVDGGYLISGHKIFTSLSPAWDWLGIHAREDSDPAHSKIVHAFVSRDAGGVRTVETWDTLGVRATASHDTYLDDVYVPFERVVGINDVGAVPGAYVAGIFPWVLPLLGNVYLGIGRRAVDVALDAARERTALSVGGAAAATKPFVQYHAAEAELVLEGATAQLDELTNGLSAGVDYGERALLRLFAAKENGTRAARTATDLALEIAGAGSIHKRNELERLYRDVRAGGFHPPNSDTVRDFIGRWALGLL
jgi:alkylation response protein AidB-like acyl-CoA dehydrogenase